MRVEPFLLFLFLASHHNIFNICSPENMVRAMKLDYEYIMRWRPNKITICPLSLLWGCHVYMQSSGRWKPFYALMSRKDLVCRFPHSWLKIVGYTQHLERCRYAREANKNSTRSSASLWGGENTISPRLDLSIHILQSPSQRKKAGAK